MALYPHQEVSGSALGIFGQLNLLLEGLTQLTTAQPPLSRQHQEASQKLQSLQALIRITVHQQPFRYNRCCFVNQKGDEWWEKIKINSVRTQCEGLNNTGYGRKD